MESLEIDILNPKAKKLLKDLADLKLISIRPSKKTGKDFQLFLDRIRSKSDNPPSPEEIADEVKAVRMTRRNE